MLENKKIERKYFQTKNEMEENEIEIDEAYVLVANQQRVSRNLRFRWYIDALSNPEAENFYDTKEQLHVIGQVPQRESITPKTDVQFIFQRYRYVFLFDFSASGNFPQKVDSPKLPI